MQAQVVDGLCRIVFADWLSTALIMGALGPLPASKLAKFPPTPAAAPVGWVDPLNDMQAAQLGIPDAHHQPQPHRRGDGARLRRHRQRERGRQALLVDKGGW